MEKLLLRNKKSGILYYLYENKETTCILKRVSSQGFRLIEKKNLKDEFELVEGEKSK
ncbi:hypothetical protein [Clostridium perfringens]|uniref:hypothetical protein n=1 Tax=Clostridium perfringens TaxID=1502 RepID=UPI0024BBFF0B|nr:hypothetical protein [Clostridium perfringens]